MLTNVRVGTRSVSIGSYCAAKTSAGAACASHYLRRRVSSLSDVVQRGVHRLRQPQPRRPVAYEPLTLR
jgi:hypothetical protein